MQAKLSHPVMNIARGWFTNKFNGYERHFEKMGYHKRTHENYGIMWGNRNIYRDCVNTSDGWVGKI